MAVPRMRVNFNTAEDARPLHPNHLFYTKIEKVITRMLDEETGVPIKTVKSFMSKIPSVFTGVDLVNWILRELPVSDLQESIHMSHLLSCHGYLFPIDDHTLTVKNDGTFYRFQTPYFWPSNCWEPENTDYAVYLCKRTMQTKAHLELEDFEAENLARLQRMFSRKWEFVFMQAEAQYKVDKKRDRLERQILDSQERAFWDVHRPVPGCVNTTEVDFRKLSRWGVRGNRAGSRVAECRPPQVAQSSGTAAGGGGGGNESDNDSEPDCKPAAAAGRPSGERAVSPCGDAGEHVLVAMPGFRRCTLADEAVRLEIHNLNERLSRNAVKTSKVVESYTTHYATRKPYDAILTPTDPPNPWIADTVDFWARDQISGEVGARRVKSWALGIDEVIADPKGREVFQKFLDKEYSGENLRFWLQVQKLRACAQRMVPILVTEIYNEFLSEGATSAVNVDSKVMDITEQNLKCSNRWSFDEAAEHIFKLMKTDSYQRFLRSELYSELQNRSIHKPQRSLFGFKQASAVYSVKD